MRQSRKALFLLLVGSLLLAMQGLGPSRAEASLTGGQYTYIVNGQEQPFVFDPIALQDGLLLPAEVFETLGAVVLQDGGTVRLSREGATAELRLGLGLVDVGGDKRPIAPAPMSVQEKLFLPADALVALGIDVQVDGRYILMRQHKVPTLVQHSAAQMERWRQQHGFTATVQAGPALFMSGEFLFLTEELSVAADMDLGLGARARLLGLLPDYSLVMVTVTNRSLTPASLRPTEFFLVDDQGRQYTAIGGLDLGEGELFARLAPSAKRRGVLLFPPIPEGVSAVRLYYDQQQGALGAVQLP